MNFSERRVSIHCYMFYTAIHPLHSAGVFVKLLTMPPVMLKFAGSDIQVSRKTHISSTPTHKKISIFETLRDQKVGC